MLDDVVDGVVVHAGSVCHDVADLIAMMSQELRSARVGLPPAVAGKDAVQIALVRRRPVDRVVGPFLSIMLP